MVGFEFVFACESALRLEAFRWLWGREGKMRMEMNMVPEDPDVICVDKTVVLGKEDMSRDNGNETSEHLGLYLST